jgi:hypothetical protein
VRVGVVHGAVYHRRNQLGGVAAALAAHRRPEHLRWRRVEAVSGAVISFCPSPRQQHPKQQHTPPPCSPPTPLPHHTRTHTHLIHMWKEKRRTLRQPRMKMPPGLAAAMGAATPRGAEYVGGYDSCSAACLRATRRGSPHRCCQPGGHLHARPPRCPLLRRHDESGGCGCGCGFVGPFSSKNSGGWACAGEGHAELAGWGDRDRVPARKRPDLCSRPE